MRSEQGEALPEPVTLLGRASKLRLNQTEAEDRLWQRLRAGRLQGLKFRRQVVVGPFIADFVCHQHKLIVEVDDSQHAQQFDYDERRTAKLERLGWHVLRVWNNDVAQLLDEVLEAILSAAHSPLPDASRLSLPAGAGRVD